MPLYEVSAKAPRIITVIIDAETGAEAEEVTRAAVSTAIGYEMSMLKVAAHEVSEEFHAPLR